MSEFYDTIQQAMHEPSTPSEIAEQRIVRSVNSVLDELDDLIAMAADNDQPEVQALVCAEQIRLGQVASRIQLLLSFIQSRQPTKLRVISNG